jgi:2-polyprenyl-6-methoxyphenol hydroxylase-like FAD-dependent oxidoreductase
MRNDALVAGGGPAGSVCARELALRGFAVTLIERSAFPRRKVCGEYLNVGAVRLLDELGAGESVRAAASPLRGIRLVPPAAPTVELPFPGTALALARETLDAILLDAARASGVTVLRAHVEDVLRDGERASGFIVRCEDGSRDELRARFIVGADGSGSLVARKLGLVVPSRGTRRFAVGGHYRGFGDLGEHVEMYVGAGAYFAINPLDAMLANVMVVVPDRSLAEWSRAVDDGVRGRAAELGRGVRSFSGTERVGARASIGPLAFDVASAAAPGALLAGDAAGFLNPFTGQGVYLALRTGRAAAQTIAAAFADPQQEAPSFERYAASRASDLRVRKRLSEMTNLLIDVPLLARRAAARLARFPDLGEALLGALSGAIAPERALSPALLARLIV